VIGPPDSRAHARIGIKSGRKIGKRTFWQTLGYWCLLSVSKSPYLAFLMDMSDFHLRGHELRPGLKLIGNGASPPSGMLLRAVTAPRREDASWGPDQAGLLASSL